MFHRALLFAAGVGLFFAGTVSAEPVDYIKQIKPILAEKCYSCHGVLKQESDLRLETRELMLKGGASGPVIVPGQPDKSLLLERVSANKDERMPPDGEGTALKPSELRLLRDWIHQGANAPDEEIPVAPQQHWAFQPIVKPTAANSIDGFLELKRKEQGLKTQPAADRPVLIRRLYLDLIGLPPTREQMHDERPIAEIVHELLKSPHHGERWGRHWMDVWRYTDWYGLGAQLRNSQKHIWHWRDWIVESLNEDKGYDRMILEMLAGDELAPEDPDVIRGTGFLARNYYLFNRTTWLDSTIEHTGKAFVGLTLNCAKCHDHKYDPISQVDYYRFRAIFEPHQVRLDPLPGEIDFEKNGLPRVFDDHLDIKTYLHIKGNDKNPDKSREIPPGVPEILSSFAPQIEPVSLPASAYAPGVRDYFQRDHLNAAMQKIEAAKRELASAEKKAAETPKPKPPETKPADQKPFELVEDFDKPNPEVWEVVGKGWKFEEGALHQTQATRDAEFVRLKQPPPEDFELLCRYTTTGGTTYKSVTFRFDQTDDNEYANFVYTSAYDAGPKVQVAYTRKGTHNYPREGALARPIKVGEAYELKLAVRKQLVNVWLNGQFLLAYNLPDRKPGGRLSLSGFDATVAFDSLSIRSLPGDVKLAEAKNAAPGKAQDPLAAVKIAKAKLAALEAEFQSLEAIFEADNAKYRDKADAGRVKELTVKAATAEAGAMKAAGEYEILLNASDEAKRKAAEGKLKEAQQKLAEIEKGSASYTSVRAAKKALETPAHKETDYPVISPETSTGRRLALARWIVSPQNPLTARVAVNHVWMRHFGEPLVESVFDFGLRAKRPEHAELLDFLAAEFMESGWSFKHLHRLIVTSEAYRLGTTTAGADPGTLAADPNNTFYWRMNTRRMEAQVVRDSLLQLAGELDPKLGGPSLEPAPGSNRRSLYFKHSRDHQNKFLGMFDDADHLQCYRRSESIVPQQALALSNSQLAIRMSDKIASSLSKEIKPASREAFVDLAFETLLARTPDTEERRECLEFCGKLEAILKNEKIADVEQRIRGRLVHALLNHNDFISIR